MQDVIDSWKSPTVTEKQLALNLRELSDPSLYPPHWTSFLEIIKTLPESKLLDVGCGCGAYYELCRREAPHITYHGIDYSEAAVKNACNQWGPFFTVKNYLDLDREFISQYEILHLGALLDILPDAGIALKFLLDLFCPRVIVGRATITDKPSFYTTYTAYDEITTYKYHHNLVEFMGTIQDSGYVCDMWLSDTIYLLKK